MTYEGLEHIDPSGAYLFISNHRDIMLDAAILQYILVINNLPSTEITFGANLMNPRIVVDIGKANRMFRVERPSASTSAREFYNISRHLSDYIRYTVTEKNASVWIAQRNGRTKDGVHRHGVEDQHYSHQHPENQGQQQESRCESYATWKATKEIGEYDTRTFEVRARPDSPVEGLLPGMSVILKRK